MSARPYLVMLGLWELLVLAGCVAEVWASGTTSFWSNALRYGVGGGAVVAALLAVLYWLDRRAHRRAELDHASTRRP